MSWDPRRVGPELAGQVVFVGIYDGHGGPSVSQFLQRELHGLFEKVQPDMVPDIVSWMKSQGKHDLRVAIVYLGITGCPGGYFKRYKGGALARWAESNPGSPTFGLEARATLAFLEVCFQV